MAARYGRFNSDGDWSNANNWSATRTGATGAAAPITGDDVYFLDPVKFHPASNLSNAAVDLESLTVGPDCNASVVNLTIAVSNSASSKFRFAGRGSWSVTAGTNGIDRAVVNPTAGGSLSLVGGTTALVENGAGTLEVEASAVVTTLDNYAVCNAAAGTAFTTANNYAGATLTSARSATTLSNDFGATATMTNSATPATLNNRGRYTHQSDGTITTANCSPRSEARALAPFTVSTLNRGPRCYAWDEEPVAVTKTATNFKGVN